MYEQDLALNNPQGLICHQPKPNQTNRFSCLCGIAQSSITKRRFFQEAHSQSREALPPPGTRCRPVLSLTPYGKMNEGITSLSLVTTPNTMM